MFSVKVKRGNVIESIHEIKSIVLGSKNKIIYSNGYDNDYIFPRSAIKIFQTIPLIQSGAFAYFDLNEKQIALASSSHSGEISHIYYLRDWLKKINIGEKYLKCGVHNPLNIMSSNKLLLSGKKPTSIYNNCSGKHLSMITTSIFNRYSIKNYTNLNHPIQKNIYYILEDFTEHKILKKSIGIDGCSIPQYAFPLHSLALAMEKVSNYKKLQFDISFCLNKLLYCISKNPFYIGGTGRFDSELMKITKGRIFCKGGAEGIIMFSDLKNKYGGIIKVKDGNLRAIPSATIKLLKKIGSISKLEENKLKKWNPETIYNHAKIKVGEISCPNL